MKKSILILIFTFFILSTTVVTAATVPNVDTSKKVYDYADLYNNQEEKDIYNKIIKIIDKYDIDLAVITINDNPFYSTQSFAETFYDKNNFGTGSDHTGLILVIDMEKREYYIVTTGETMKTINDYRVESILDVMESDMKAGNYYDATSSFIRKTNSYYSYHKYGHPLLWLAAIVASVVFAFIRLNIEKKKLKLINDRLEASNYLLDQTIEEQQDNLVDTHTRVIVHSSGSGGSSGGGGGGGSHGGGGRSF